MDHAARILEDKTAHASALARLNDPKVMASAYAPCGATLAWASKPVRTSRNGCDLAAAMRETQAIIDALTPPRRG